MIISGQISAKNIAAYPAFTGNSYVELLGVGPGSQTVTIGTNTSGSGSTLAVWVASDNVYHYAIPAANVVAIDGMTSWGTATDMIYTTVVPEGNVWVVCTSFGSGTVNVTMAAATADVPTSGFNQTLTVSNTAQPLSSNQPLTAGNIVLRAPSTNTGPVIWAPNDSIMGHSIAASNGASFIEPGAAASVNASNLNQIYFCGVANDLLSYEAA